MAIFQVKGFFCLLFSDILDISEGCLWKLVQGIAIISLGRK